MVVERQAGTSGSTSLIDVLDRVLDKGIVVDAWVRVSLVGIDLVTVEARIVVASIDTYLRYAEAVGVPSLAGRSAYRESEQRAAFGEPAASAVERVDVEQEQRAPSRRGQRR